MLVIALLVLTPVPSARAIDPVDDFERGDFSRASFAYAEYTIGIPGSAGHAMHTQRKVILESTGDLASATTGNSTPFPDQALSVYSNTTGTVVVLWDWGGARDLTVLGDVDRVDMLLGDSPPGGQVTMILTDAGGSEQVVVPATGGFETLSFPFSAFTSVDPSQATSLGFRFGSGADSYYVSEIRFHHTGSLAVDFTGNFVATQVPPVPSAPLQFSLLDELSNPIYDAEIAITGAVSGGPVEMDADWSSRMGTQGEQATVAFQWDEFGVFSDTYFTLSFDLLPAGGLTPDFFPPDPIHDDPSIIRLEFPVTMMDGAVPVGNLNTLILIDVDSFQGAEFVTAATSGHAGGFDLSFDIVGGGGVEVYEPLFHVTWVTDWEPVAVTGIPEGDTRAPALVAWPSVTRGATELRVGRPFGPGARIEILDVAGRRIRSLSPAAGELSIGWDGRDAAGRWPGAGVYFIRLVDAGSAASTRVTVLR
jgi:hypothetical protein